MREIRFATQPVQPISYWMLQLPGDPPLTAGAGPRWRQPFCGLVTSILLGTSRAALQAFIRRLRDTYGQTTTVEVYYRNAPYGRFWGRLCTVGEWLVVPSGAQHVVPAVALAAGLLVDVIIVRDVWFRGEYTLHPGVTSATSY